ncbi:MAG: hypothetical protein ACR2RL_21820 [Gammaproteobacteria bacterium]
MRSGISNPYAGIGHGLGQLGGALIGLPGARDQGRRARESQLLKNYYLGQQGRKTGLEASGLETEQAGLRRAVEDTRAKYGDLGASLLQADRTDNLQHLQQGDFRERASQLAESNPSLANRLIEYSSGRGTPYKVQGGGVIDTTSGGFDITPVGEADVYQKRAAGASSYGSAAASNALAALRQRELDAGVGSGLPSGYRYADPASPRAGAEPIPGYAPQVGDRFDDTAKLRKQFVTLSGDFIKQRDAFGRIEASAVDPSPAGDLALIFNYMKVLDPGSVVRESEFATAQNSAAVPDQVRNVYNRVMTGERLNPTQRADFVQRARLLMKSAQANHGRLTTQFAALAQRSQIAPEDVVIDLSAPEIDWGGGGELANQAQPPQPIAEQPIAEQPIQPTQPIADDLPGVRPEIAELIRKLESGR